MMSRRNPHDAALYKALLELLRHSVYMSKIHPKSDEFGISTKEWEDACAKLDVLLKKVLWQYAKYQDYFKKNKKNPGNLKDFDPFMYYNEGYRYGSRYTSLWALFNRVVAPWMRRSGLSIWNPFKKNGGHDKN